MHTWTDTLNEIAPRWTETVWHAGWQAACVAAAILILVRCCPRMPSSWRYALLLLALAKFAVPPTLALPTGVFSAVGSRLGHPAAHGTPAEDRPPSVTALVAAERAAESVRRASTDTAARPPTAGAPEAASAPRLSSAACLMLIHWAGSGLLLAWLLCQARALHRLTAKATPVTGGPIAAALRRVCETMQLAKPPRLLLSDRPVGPAACGVLRRSILMPPSALLLSRIELETVLAHEVAHHRRGDLLAQRLQQLVLGTWWFHPLLWPLARAIRSAQEDCCDDAVLARGITTNQRYCHTLLRAAALLAASRSVPAAAHILRHRLGTRLRRIMSQGRRPLDARSFSWQRRAAICAWAVAASLALPGLSTHDRQDPRPHQTRTVRGRVIDETGGGVGDATLFLAIAGRTHDITEWRAIGSTDSDGRFSAAVGATDFDAMRRRYRVLVAIAKSHGPGWVQVEDELDRALQIRLPAPTSAEGVVLDLEGQPVAGAHITPLLCYAPKSGTLSEWLAAVDAVSPAAAMDYMGKPVNLNQPGHWPAAVTDAQGRFILRGLGRDQLIHATIAGDGIATDEIGFVTRDVEAFESHHYGGVLLRGGYLEPRSYYGRRITHIATAERPVTGVVRDANTGAPIAGLTLEAAFGVNATGRGARHVRAVTDADGRYELRGLRKADDGRVCVRESLALGYAGTDRALPNPPGLDPLIQDFEVHPAVRLRVRIIEQGTGTPTEADVVYSPARDNPNLRTRGIRSVHTNPSALHELLALPGEGAVAVFAGPEYLTLAEREGASIDEGASIVRFRDYATHAYAVIEPTVGTSELELTFELVRGRDYSLQLFDENGAATAATQLFSARHFGGWSPAPQEGTATLAGFNPRRPRTVYAIDEARNLAGHLTVDDASAPLRLSLGPAGTITGVLQDEDGLPRGGASLRVTFVPHGRTEHHNTHDAYPRTGADGSFRIAPVIPGAAYRIEVQVGEADSEYTMVRREIVVDTGEQLDLGTVRAEQSP